MNNNNERIKADDFTPQLIQELDTTGKFKLHPDANTIYSFIAYVMAENCVSVPRKELINVIRDFKICETDTKSGYTIRLMSGSWLCTGNWFE